MIPTALLRDTFTLKKPNTITTAGRVTQTITTVATGIKGYFQPKGGTIIASALGRVKQYSMKLFTPYYAEIRANRIVEYNDYEYIIVSVDSFHSPGQAHHMEVYLEERRTDIG